jgi:hypothetical protein
VEGWGQMPLALASTHTMTQINVVSKLDLNSRLEVIKVNVK